MTKDSDLRPLCACDEDCSLAVDYDRLRTENERLRNAAQRIISVLVADGDPPSLVVPKECDQSDFIQAYEQLSKALGTVA